jgi:hypothetical protein
MSGFCRLTAKPEISLSCFGLTFPTSRAGSAATEVLEADDKMKRIKAKSQPFTRR